MTEQGKMTDAEIVESYTLDFRRKTVVSDHTTELIALFEDCQKEADYHSAVGLYGYVSFEEVLEKRGAEWLAEHDAKVQAEALREFAGVVREVAALGPENTGLRKPAHLAEYAANYADRIEREAGL